MQPIVMPAVTAFSTFSIRISRSTELALSSRSPARERWRLRLLRYFPGAELAPDRNAATLARRGTTLKKGRSPIARSDSLFLVRRPRGAPGLHALPGKAASGSADV